MKVNKKIMIYGLVTVTIILAGTIVISQYFPSHRLYIKTITENGIVVGTGTIHYLEFEGGFWGIISDDGEPYDVGKLPSEFRKGGLHVRFKAEIRENQVSIHMWGTIVDILEIESW
jgi:hypothetical protein